MKQSRVVHPIPPEFDAHSRVLILGSFPSVKSRETAFFYGHPQNRFWKVLAAVKKEPVPASIEEKKAFLSRHGIALWDVIASCTITGSSDASIQDVVPNDISRILQETGIKRIYCNGGKSKQLYDKWIRPETGVEAVLLPSTSPANASWNLDRLVETWKQID